MDRFERAQRDRELESYKQSTLTMLAAEGLAPPDTTGPNWLKWYGQTDDAQIIVRFGTAGGWTLDVQWIDPDGHANGLFCPKDAYYLPRLARDVARLIASHDRDVLTTLGRAEVNQ